MLRLLVWLLILGVLLYGLFSLLDRRSAVRWFTSNPDSTERPSRRLTVPPRPMGPDDDEEFLRELDRRRREE